MSQRVADIRIDPAMIESFGRTMRQKLTSGSVPFRKAYLRALVDIIEVDDAHIRIKGCKDVLERAVLTRRAGMSLRWRGDYLVCSSRVRAPCKRPYRRSGQQDDRQHRNPRDQPGRQPIPQEILCRKRWKTGDAGSDQAG